jgi:hypothetical protein
VWLETDVGLLRSGIRRECLLKAGCKGPSLLPVDLCNKAHYQGDPVGWNCWYATPNPDTWKKLPPHFGQVVDNDKEFYRRIETYELTEADARAKMLMYLVENKLVTP